MNKNVPNILTMSRIFLTPLVVLFYLLPISNGVGKIIAFVIYALACFTDLLDGKIARKYNLVSDFGKFMDQIADKFITTTSMVLVLFEFAERIGAWASIVMLLVVILRDILISGIRMYAASKNIVIAADFFGKIKSLFLDTANAVLIFDIALYAVNLQKFADVLFVIGMTLMVVGVALSVISCVNYIKNALVSLKKKVAITEADKKNNDFYRKEHETFDSVINYLCKEAKVNYVEEGEEDYINFYDDDSDEKKDDKTNEILAEATRLALQKNEISPTIIQKHFDISFLMSVFIIEKMKKYGFVDYDSNGSKYNILISPEQFKEIYGVDALSNNPVKINLDLIKELDNRVDEQDSVFEKSANYSEKSANKAKNFDEKREFLNSTLGNADNKYEEYNVPELSILSDKSEDSDNFDAEQQETAKKIEQTLSLFKIQANVIDIVRGATFTRYELSVALGTPNKKVLAHEIDLKRALEETSLSVNLIPGKETVAVDVANKRFTLVSFKKLLESDEYKNFDGQLPIVFGKDVYGNVVVRDLTKLIHLFIAGQSGSGKSIFLHTLIMSLIYKNSPDDLKLVLIDPKKVEFYVYSKLPHLINSQVVMGTNNAVSALSWCASEMDRRYKLLTEAGYNNIAVYNRSESVKKGYMPKLPNIVVVIDEYAELVAENKDEVEKYVKKLAQLARAAGIHLVIATQRTSTDVVTGLIKNNIPARVAFNLSSQIDSTIAIDTTGAEKLIGHGDMLFVDYGTSNIQRLQAGYCPGEDIRKFIDYITENNKTEQTGEFDIFEKPALKELIKKGVASGSYLQRKFQIGYARAARLIDYFESKGYIEPSHGGKTRKIIITPQEFKEIYGEEIDMTDTDGETEI